MFILYLDASAWVKRYTGERGWDVIDALFDETLADKEAGLISSALSRAEVFSAFVRFRNRTDLPDDKFDAGMGQLTLDGNRLYWLQIGEESFQHSLSFILKHNINATDGAILRELLSLRDQVHTAGYQLWLIASDKRLLRAAGMEGLPCLDPEISSPREVHQLLAAR